MGRILVMGSRQARMVATVVAGVCALTLAIAARIGSGPLQTVDVRVARALHRAVSPHPALVSFWKAVSLIGGPVVWDVFAAGLAVALCVRRRYRTAAFVALAVAGAATLSTVLKIVIGRPRPSLPDPLAHAAGMSFPSGHALTSSVATAALLMVLAPAIGRGTRAWVAGAALLVVAAIGFSRLALGVHYLTDVVGAWLIAALWLLALTRVLHPPVQDRRPVAGTTAAPPSRSDQPGSDHEVLQ